MKKHILLALFGFLSCHLFSQHEHHAMVDTLPTKRDAMQKKPTTKKTTAMDSMDHSMHMVHTMPSHAYSRSLPMSRNGSGTGWNQDESPMYMWMKSTGKN
jgi:hypothetical protein